MLTYSFHFSQFNNYQFSQKNPSLAQFILRIYNKIIIKILGYFWGVTGLLFNVRSSHDISRQGCSGLVDWGLV